MPAKSAQRWQAAGSAVQVTRTAKPFAQPRVLNGADLKANTTARSGVLDYDACERHTVPSMGADPLPVCSTNL
jgi:hypothetical protein